MRCGLLGYSSNRSLFDRLGARIQLSGSLCAAGLKGYQKNQFMPKTLNKMRLRYFMNVLIKLKCDFLKSHLRHTSATVLDKGESTPSCIYVLIVLFYMSICPMLCGVDSQFLRMASLAAGRSLAFNASIIHWCSSWEADLSWCLA